MPPAPRLRLSECLKTFCPYDIVSSVINCIGDFMKIAFLILFALDAALHLWSRLSARKTLNRVTKALLLLLLAAWYLTAADPVRPIVLAAILFSWLGDVLLIPDGTGWFVAGGISFAVSHVCFMLSYLRHIRFAILPWWLIALSVAVCAAAVLLIFRSLRPHLPKLLFWPMMFYLFVNGVMNCFAAWQHLSALNLVSAVACLGALLFFVSDSLLFYVRFAEKYRDRPHFWVMLTYTLAEFLIVWSLAGMK